MHVRDPQPGVQRSEYDWGEPTFALPPTIAFPGNAWADLCQCQQKA